MEKAVRRTIEMMVENNVSRRSVIFPLPTCLLLFFLFVPSAWMIATIPPLWRDADAYNQLVQDPRIATFWGHGPAYCYLAKVPLFIGEQLERGLATGPVSGGGLSQPFLTDTGVWLLIISQHLALCGTSFYFISRISSVFWVRLALVLGWASNPLFYTFAHCVGSESLSMIFVLLLAGQAVRLVTVRPEPSWLEWYLYALALLGVLLSRHVNLCLVGLMPITLLLSWALQRFGFPPPPGENRQRLPNAMPISYLSPLVLSIGIGFACVFVAASIPKGLARQTKLHPHSRVGFTFLWRLRFLDTLSPESRTALLHKLRLKTHSPGARQLLTLLEQMRAEAGDERSWHPFMERAIQLFGGSLHWEQLDAALNQMASVFLLPPAPELLEVAKKDFLAALRTPPTEVSSYLFDTTAYYFAHQEEMTGCGKLVTFRNTNAKEIETLPSRHPYLQFWKSLTFNQAFVIWSIILLSLLALSRGRTSDDPGGIVALGVTMISLGLVMFGSACFLADDQPRFRLPMWQLWWGSLFLFLGKTAALWKSRHARRGGKEGSAGQLCRPEP